MGRGGKARPWVELPDVTPCLGSHVSVWRDVVTRSLFAREPSPEALVCSLEISGGQMGSRRILRITTHRLWGVLSWTRVSSAPLLPPSAVQGHYKVTLLTSSAKVLCPAPPLGKA